VSALQDYGTCFVLLLVVALQGHWLRQIRKERDRYLGILFTAVKIQREG